MSVSRVEPEKKEEKEEKQSTQNVQADLTAVNNLIFFMHATDSKYQSQGQLRPKVDYANTNIAKTVAEYKTYCADLKSSLDKAGFSDDEKAQTEKQIDQISEKLALLDTRMKNKVDDWIGNKRSMHKENEWDPAFKAVTASIDALQKSVDEKFKTPGADDAQKAFQTNAKKLDSNNLQNKTFNDDVSHLKDSLYSQKITNYNMIKRQELGYDAPGKKRIWDKVFLPDQSKIEENAKKLTEGEPIAQIGAKEKDSDKQREIGPGTYRLRDPASPFFMKVDEKGMVEAVDSNESSIFPIKLLSSVASIAGMAWAKMTGASEEDMDARKQKLRELWSSTSYQAKISEMMDFAITDASGQVKSDTIIFGFKDCNNLRPRHIEKARVAFELAKTKGVDFHLSKALFDGLALASVSGTDAFVKEVTEYNEKFASDRQILEKQGEAMQPKKAELSEPSGPAISDGDKKVIEQNKKDLGDMRKDVKDGKLNAGNAELKISELAVLQQRISDIQAALPKANEKEVTALREAVQEVKKTMDAIKEYAKDHADLNEKLTNPDPKIGTAVADVAEIEKNCNDAVTSFEAREAELVTQRDIEDKLAALGLRDDRTGDEPAQDFKSTVAEAISGFDKVMNGESSDVADNAKTHEDAKALQAAIEPLMPKSPLTEAQSKDKKITDLMEHLPKFQEASKKLSDTPAPSAAPRLSK